MGLFSGISDALFGSDDAVKINQVDPNEVIGRQAQVNRVNQTTPFGSVSFSGPDNNQLDFQLSPQLQALFQTQTGFGNQAGQAGSQLLGQSGIAPIGTQDVSGLSQGLFDLGSSRTQPLFDRRRELLQEQLAQSGNPATGADLSPGSVSELDLLNLQENNFLSDLSLQSALAGPQFQNQLLQNQALQQGTNIGGALALGQGSPIGVPQFNFQGATPIDVTSSFGLGQQGQAFNAQQTQQQREGILGGLFDLGGAAFGRFGGG